LPVNKGFYTNPGFVLPLKNVSRFACSSALVTASDHANLVNFPAISEPCAVGTFPPISSGLLTPREAVRIDVPYESSSGEALRRSARAASFLSKNAGFSSSSYSLSSSSDSSSFFAKGGFLSSGSPSCALKFSGISAFLLN
jgi:hypothetical protein